MVKYIWIINTFRFSLQLKYKETFNQEKGHYIGSDDTPALSHSREMSKLYSDVSLEFPKFWSPKI